MTFIHGLYLMIRETSSVSGTIIIREKGHERKPRGTVQEGYAYQETVVSWHIHCYYIYYGVESV
jgi:hypothetical protein